MLNLHESYKFIEIIFYEYIALVYNYSNKNDGLSNIQKTFHWQIICRVYVFCSNHTQSNRYINLYVGISLKVPPTSRIRIPPAHLNKARLLHKKWLHCCTQCPSVHLFGCILEWIKHNINNAYNTNILRLQWFLSSSPQT